LRLPEKELHSSSFLIFSALNCCEMKIFAAPSKSRHLNPHYKIKNIKELHLPE
jgi:hypothetical protein